MNMMPEPTNISEQINDSLAELAPDDSTEYGKGYADGYVAGVAYARTTAVTAGVGEDGKNARTVAKSPAQQLVDDTAARWAAENRRLLRCPDWCTDDHGPVDERDDLITHMGDDHTDGTVRRLLGGRVEVQVARTDCPLEGKVGVPNLYVRCEVELTTWEQAAELARAILDGFGYLKGADQD